MELLTWKWKALALLRFATEQWLNVSHFKIFVVFFNFLYIIFTSYRNEA